jgi:ribosome-associated toxin RatA of RatAB toxin-antitoxin module
MAEQATERTTIGAPPDLVYETALDIERYPEWAQDIKEATVVERDDQGRPVRVRFRAAAMGHSARYVLSYDHSDAPRRLAWILEQGDIVRKLDGEYQFEPAPNGGTEVTYHLEAELAVPLPGFIKRRAESKIMTTALEELRHRCEDASVR